MIEILIGDMFKSGSQTLVNTVNCVGVMGKGIAEEFKKRYPEMFLSYKKDCELGRIVPGKLSFYGNLFNKNFIINFPTKNHWKSPTLLKDIEDGLNYFLAHYKAWGITSVAFPPLGCGNGGLTWSVVGPLMYGKLKDLDIPVKIYAPFGTSAKELTKEFLEEGREVRSGQKGSWVRGNLTIGQVAVLEVLYRLQQEKYTKPIGRTMYQKACYFLSKAGVETGFIFERNNYGPFSKEAESALSIYANKNLTQEERLGKMFRLTVTDNFKNIRLQYKDELEQFKDGIDRAVDLLSRIKDTSQGEEIATVMYAASVLNIEHKGTLNSNDIIQYTLDWKKRWKEESGKKDSLKETISDLNMLNWLSLAQ